MSMNQQEVSECSSMLRALGVPELQTLLGLFGYNRFGGQTDLLDRALDLLRHGPVGFNYQTYLAQIRELFRSIQPLREDEIAHYNNMVDTYQGNMVSMSRLTSSPRLFYPTQLALQLDPQDYELIPCLPRHQANQENYQPVQNRASPQMMRRAENGTQGQNAIALNHNFQQPVNFKIISTNRHHLLTDNTRLYRPNLMYDNTVSLPILFKKLPFYDVIDDVLQPTTLLGRDQCTITNGPKGMRENAIKIRLLCHHVNQITMNRNVSNGKTEYPYQIQTRICELAPGAEISDHMPMSLFIRINGKVLPLPPPIPHSRPGPEARRKPRPLNLTPLFKLNPNLENVVQINWVPDEKTYIMGMYLVKKLSSDILLKRLYDKGASREEETKNYIIRQLAKIDPELMTTSYRVSLICPLSKMRMNIPAKSTKCDHLQCFDASTFILMNEKNPTWMCPTCNNTCLFDDIRISSYFLKIVTSPSLPDTCKEVEVIADGTWRVFEEKDKTNKTKTAAQKKPIESVDLSDSDDDKSGKSNNRSKRFKPKSLKQPRKLNTLVDLTLISDDENAVELPNSDVSETKENSGPSASRGYRAALNTIPAGSISATHSNTMDF